MSLFCPTAPEPRDIQWFNLNLSSSSRFIRGVLVLIILLVLLSVWLVPVLFLAQLLSWERIQKVAPRLADFIGKKSVRREMFSCNKLTCCVHTVRACVDSFRLLCPLWLWSPSTTFCHSSWMVRLWSRTCWSVRLRADHCDSFLSSFDLPGLASSLLGRVFPTQEVPPDTALHDSLRLCMWPCCQLVLYEAELTSSFQVTSSTYTLLRYISDSPAQLPEKLAMALPGARNFFVSYVMLSGTP